MFGLQLWLLFMLFDINISNVQMLDLLSMEDQNWADIVEWASLNSKHWQPECV